MDSSVSEVEPLTDDEAEAAFIALIDLLDGLGCSPAATVASKDDEGFTASLHFHVTRARKLIEALSRRAAGDDVGRLREAASRVVELAQNEGVATGDYGRAAWGSAVRELDAALTSTSAVAVEGG